LQLAPCSRNAGQNRLLALNYSYPGEHPFVCKAHAEWGNEVQSLVQQLPDLDHEAIDWDPERCLTVGYISPDLFTHSVSYFAEAPLSHHNSGRYMAFTQYMAFLILQVIIHSAAILAL